MLKVLYSVFIGILVATFVGLGVAAFYPAPERPEYPESPKTEAFDTSGRSTLLTPAEQRENERQQKEYDEKYKKYEEAQKAYTLRVAIITLVAAVVALVASVTFMSKTAVVADGLLMGGVFTLIYSVIRSLFTEDFKVMFVFVTLGLIIALVIGRIKFPHLGEAKPKTSK